MPAATRPHRTLAEVLTDLGLLAESEVVLANERGDGTARFVLDGLMRLPPSPSRAVLRICLVVWQVNTPDADRRIGACLTELGVTECSACALNALGDDGPCDLHEDAEGCAL